MAMCEALGTMHRQHLAIKVGCGLVKEPLGNDSEDVINLVIINRRNIADTPRPKKVSCLVGMVFSHSFVIRGATGGKHLPKGSVERRA